MSDHIRRHDAIARLLREHEVHSQENLQAALRKRGYRVTQPTLSRDLRALGVAKTPKGYVLPEDLGAPLAPVVPLSPGEARETHFEQVVREFVISAEKSGTLVVVRTPPAGAPPVARAVDEARLTGAVGCISGDDTVFVAMTSSAGASGLLRRIHSLLNVSHPRRRRA